MNIIQIQARLKDLSDQQLQQIMQQGGAGMAPEYLVLSELNRRAGMRQAQAASQPVDDTTVAQEVMAAPGLPQAVGNQMAQTMRPEGAQQSTARFAEGGIVQGYEGGGAIGKGIDGVTYPTALPQPKPAGVNYRVSEPSAMDLERLRQFEEKYGSIPEATAPTQDRQSWSDWFFGLINPRSDAQRARDAYVPTVEDSNMFGYAEGGIVQAYEDGGLTGPGWMEERFGKGQLTDMAAGPATPIGPYMQQGVALGLTADQTREAYDRNIPLEGLGEYKIGFVDSPRELDVAPIVAPKPPTPVVTPTAKPMPVAPAVDTTPIPTAPSVALPAATPAPIAPAPKFDEKAYTQAVSSFGVPGGVSDLTRESRRNAMLALAKAGFALAGSKEVTAGGAIGEAAKTGIAAYEAGAKDIAAQKEARRKEGIAQARQEMLDRRAMAKDQFDRYYKMQSLEQQRAAASSRAERDALSAELNLMRAGAAIQSAQATADRYKQSEERQRAEATLRYAGDALKALTGMQAQAQFQASLKKMKEGERRTAIDARNQQIKALQAQMDAARNSLVGDMYAPSPGAASPFDAFGTTRAFQGD